MACYYYGFFTIYDVEVVLLLLHVFIIGVVTGLNCNR